MPSFIGVLVSYLEKKKRLRKIYIIGVFEIIEKLSLYLNQQKK